MRCRYLDDAAMVPAAGTDASSHFLTVGTRCGNSARCGLRACTWGVFVPQVPLPQSRQAVVTQSSQRNPSSPETNCRPHSWLGLRSTREFPMTNQNQNPGQQNQNPNQKPGQQQGGGQKPGQQQQDPNRQGQKPGQQQQDPNRQGQNPNQQGKGGR